MCMTLIIEEEQSKLNEKLAQSMAALVDSLVFHLPSLFPLTAPSPPPYLSVRNLLMLGRWGEEGKKQQTFLLEVTIGALKYISWEGFKKSV